MSSNQIFLRLTMARGNKIRGEASAGGYDGLIEVENFTWAVSSKYSLRQDRAKVRPQINYDKVKVSKLYDVSSVSLASHMNGRIAFKTAEIIVDHHLQETGLAKAGNPLMVIELRNGYIEDIRISVSEGKLAATVREDMSLSFMNFKITYHPGGADRMKRMAAVSFESMNAET
jgi:type VI protein secretion system component Hcp